MGQKVHPTGFRIGINKDWNSRWYANDKDFATYLVEDHKIRTYLKKTLYAARISEIIIERNKENVKVYIYAAKPGMVIGKNGAQLEETKLGLAKEIKKEVQISVIDIKRPDLDGQVVAENIAAQLERRISFRRAMKQGIERTQRAGAEGIKVAVSGRLNGAEMARTEGYQEGKVPLQTIRADISYGFAEANTTYGKLGVKVWINRGEIFEKGLRKEIKEKGPRNKDTNRKRTPKRRQTENKEVRNGDNTEKN